MMNHSVEVKICGLTNRDDVVAALDLGADYLGFVLFSRSPRGITFAELVRILDKVDEDRKAIGVFVNESRDNVEKIAADCGLYAVQLHGDEKQSDFVDMPVPVWRSIRLCAETWRPLPENWQVSRYVIDADVPGLYGGTGTSADWKSASGLADRYPVMLAGGLTPGNVADAVRIVKPVGVDVSSGVEAEPGKKDHDKIKAFIRRAKEVKCRLPNGIIQ